MPPKRRRLLGRRRDQRHERTVAEMAGANARSPPLRANSSHVGDFSGDTFRGNTAGCSVEVVRGGRKYRCPDGSARDLGRPVVFLGGVFPGIPGSRGLDGRFGSICSVPGLISRRGGAKTPPKTSGTQPAFPRFSGRRSSLVDIAGRPAVGRKCRVLRARWSYDPVQDYVLGGIAATHRRRMQRRPAVPRPHRSVWRGAAPGRPETPTRNGGSAHLPCPDFAVGRHAGPAVASPARPVVILVGKFGCSSRVSGVKTRCGPGEGEMRGRRRLRRISCARIASWKGRFWPPFGNARFRAAPAEGYAGIGGHARGTGADCKSGASIHPPKNCICRQSAGGSLAGSEGSERHSARSCCMSGARGCQRLRITTPTPASAGCALVFRWFAAEADSRVATLLAISCHRSGHIRCGATRDTTRAEDGARRVRRR